MEQRGWALGWKRAADVAFAGAALLGLAPVAVGVAAVVRLRAGRPVLFRQVRAGRGGVPFEILKFRTMTEERGPDGRLLPDEQRLRRLGRFLRASSLDELPQLLNVLRGDMSLVGPRPLPVAYVPRYSERHRRRLEVLPGITGWAQIHGRNAVEWRDRLDRDVWYVEHWSPLLDAWILARTAVHLAAPRGVSAEGHATMPEFVGLGDAPLPGVGGPA